VFVIADLHLGHKKLAEVRGFPSYQAHDDAIVQAWNRVVAKRDVVYVLGDVFRLDLVPVLNGTKKLALGNHDQRPVRVYAELFSQVRAMFEFDGCLLTHIPVHPGQFGRYELNVHGHTHAHHLDDERYVPVSVEHCGPRMEPLPLRELIQARRERIELQARWDASHPGEGGL
jgi:calcineurin-like phosphoesterase family protein